jgi:hypothetical protein
MESKIEISSSPYDKFLNGCFVGAVFLSLASINIKIFDLYLYYFFIVLALPLLIYRYRVLDKGFVVSYCVLILSGILNIILGNNDVFSLLKNVIGLFFAYSFYYLIIKHNDYDLNKLFRLYYKFSYVTALIGFVQFFSFLIGFKPGYEFRWLNLRVMESSEFAGLKFYTVHSITGEPSALAILLSPAIYVAMNNLKQHGSVHERFVAITILSVYLLTQSSTAYFGIICSVAVLTMKNISLKKILLAVIAIPATIFLLVAVSPKFSDRLNSSVKLATGNIVLDAATSTNANGSSVILFNHFVIAAENANHHPFGTGLGSHHLAFERYNTLRTWFTGYGGVGSMILNLHDANSLFSRILSEMGYPGVILLIIFLFKNFIPSSTNDTSNMILINHASLMALLTNLLRGGHYFNLGLPFFVFCYYYSKKFQLKSPL